jgi:hypothetical protein
MPFLCYGDFLADIMKKTKEAAVKTYIPAQIYLYDYKSLFVRSSVTIAVSIIVYSALFGITW